MKQKRLIFFLFIVSMLVFTHPGAARADNSPPADTTVVRACVIGGMTMTGLWQEISKRFTARTGIRVDTVITGPRPRISVPFRQGMADGAAALRKIMETRSNYLDGYGTGKREVGQKLWKKLHTKPVGSWVLKDESARNKQMLVFASEKNAYMIFGRMPVLFGKVDTGNLKIMVEGDPAMRRPYVMVEANPALFPHANHTGARALSDFILSKEIQTFMKKFGVNESGRPWFYPAWPYNT